MERVQEEKKKGKRSNRWLWPLAALVVVFLAVAATSKIGFFFNSPKIFSYSHQESGELRVSQKHEKLKASVETRQWRERPPSSYSVKFDSCKTMMDLVKDGFYESLPFTAGGLNWTFLIYPAGIIKNIWFPFVSLYVRIDNSSVITDPQDVYAEIKFFVYYHFVNRLYYYSEETEPMMFNSVKREYGVPNFLDTNLLKVPGTAYIFDGGICEFGVDVFVAPPFNDWETFSYAENISTNFTWSLSDFSTLISPDFNTSDPFSSGGRNWVLKVYPNGYGVGTDNSLSLYLLSETNEKDYVRATLRVLNQIPSHNVEKQVEGWPNAAENGWGFEEFMPLSDLKDGTKGFVVDDVLQVEVEIRALSNITSK